ncbi:hypothetical protein VMCG_10790 [Cytospora schulzeri]|uniref:Uncharacterized protein n=1 Tax=Cytospora schulzeri TaxID=448051 RepID=A0A423VA84_9PEZI|nr:hypothetical protein VMCG_10790 [Valsa malicola]
MLAVFSVFLVPKPVKAVEAFRFKLVPCGLFVFSSRESFLGEQRLAGSEVLPKESRADLIKFRAIEVVQADGYFPLTDHEEVCRFILTKMPLAARVITQISDEEVPYTQALMVSELEAKYPKVPSKIVGKAAVAYYRK